MCHKTLFLGQKQAFPNIPNIWNILNTLFSVYTEYTEYIASKSNLYFHKKLVPTQILIQNLITSLEVRALISIVIKFFHTIIFTIWDLLQNFFF